jgi:hypothetical protein
MRNLILTVAGLVCAVVWLGLLVVTNFNMVTVGAGLLVVLYVTGSPGTTRSNVVRTHRLR